MSLDIPVYEQQADLYRADYGACIRQVAHLHQVDLIGLAQTPGDFSDRPSGDLQIIRTMGRSRAHVDFGGGKFSQWTETGGLFVNPVGYGNSILVDHHHQVEGVCIRWTALVERDAEGLLPRDSDFGSVHRSMIQDSVMNQIIDQLWQCEGGDADAMTVESALCAITQRLVQWRQSPKPTRRMAVEKLAPIALARSKERLAAPGADTVTLGELATLCNLSVPHFCRAFKAATGLPPHRYQIVARIERARSLLLETRFPISEIALLVGYSDPAYFSRIFTRETGVSPSVWRAGR